MAAWRFVSLPKEVSERLRSDAGPRKRGWGAVPVEVRIKDARWRTSVFPDKRSGTFLLPLKAEVRKKERMLDGDTVRVDLRVVARP